ncbi:MAG: glycoside hydrolase family 1 protein [Candidatus Omnitrophica bacterium]|nr:glycoside hydrolase family 1 protein [Candidatus Omnitrophota bacterium]
MKTFPENFLWGAAMSAHQVEGNNSNNDWWKWEQEGNTEPSGDACNHYNRYKEDFLLAKQLNHNAHRLSIEWSRLEKTEDSWDEKEWAHYKDVVRTLDELGIEPVVSLNHFTIPLWLAQKGGWTNEQSPEYFARFTEKAAIELGDKVRYWITITEPNIVAMLEYLFGIWPPCIKDFNIALIVLKNLLKGHVLAYSAVKSAAAKNPKIKKPIIGISHAVTAFHPCSPFSLSDRFCTYYRSKFHNYAFITSAIKGKVLIPGVQCEKLPAKNTVDFIGLNYYFRQFIQHQKPFLSHPLGEVCSLSHHHTPGGITDMGWEIYPRGIYEVTKSFYKRYKLPIMITENGLATKDDAIRKSFIKDHLEHLLRAINENCNVLGYLHWSLMDNFEWAEGYSKKFGLIKIDRQTQERTILDSARYYASVIATGKP